MNRADLRAAVITLDVLAVLACLYIMPLACALRDGLAVGGGVSSSGVEAVGRTAGTFFELVLAIPQGWVAGGLLCSSAVGHICLASAGPRGEDSAHFAEGGGALPGELNKGDYNPKTGKPS